MKKSIYLLVACTLLATTMVQAQWNSNQGIKGNGNVISEKRTTSSYDKISVIGFFDVELVSGKEGDITIKGEENLLPHIIIEVVNQELKITTEKNKNINTSKGKKIEIKVPIETMNQVSLTGSGDITSKKLIKSDSFVIILTGSGDIKLSVESENVDVNLTGSGDIVLNGKTENITSNLNGSGDIKASSLSAKNAKVTVSGSGDSSVSCSESIHARVNGSGDIKYIGDPQNKDTKVSGSGSIKKV